jgi:MFS family permease
MKRSLAPVAALLISVSILLAGQGLQSTLLPVRASLENFSTFAIGAMGAAYFLGFTIGCVKGPELIRSVGHVRVFLAMTALASAAPLIHGLFVTQWTWALLRLITGFCFAAIYIVIESWLNDRATNENRGFIFSTYAMITLTVLAAGQMMTLIYEPTGMQLFAICAVLVSLAAIPIALSTAPSPQPPHSAAINIKHLFHVSPTGAAGCLATGLVNGSYWALAPVFTQGVSSDAALAAWFMAAAVIGGAITQWPLGIGSDRIGRRPMFFGVSFVGAISCAALVVLAPGASFTTIVLLAAFWGGMGFPLYSIAVAYANDFADPDEYVNISSGLLLMYGAGATLGPFFASAVMELTDYTGLYVFSGAVYVLLVAIATIRAIASRGVAKEKQVEFRTALAAAQTKSQVYEEEVAQQPEKGSE